MKYLRKEKTRACIVIMTALSIGVLFGWTETANADFMDYIEMQQDVQQGLQNLYSVAVSPDDKHVYTASSDEYAIGVFSRNADTGALTYVERQIDGQNGVDGLYGVEGVTVSPDGAHVYAAGVKDDSVAVFSRNEGTGALTYVERQRDGMNGVDGLDGVRSVTVSPDGAHVYAAGQLDNAIAVFSRNETTGALTFVEMQQDGVGGVDGLATAWSVTVSPDNAHVYAVSYADDAVVVFSRNAGTGALTFVEMQQDGVGGVDGLDAAKAVTVSPDGAHVYVGSGNDRKVAIFSRNLSTGALTYLTNISLSYGVESITFSSDGTHVYTGEQNYLRVYSRNATSGALTFVQRLQNGVNGVDGLLGTKAVTISTDEAHVYTAAYFDDAVAVFSRNEITGELTFVEMQQDGLNVVDGLDGAGSVTVSPDGAHLYAAGQDEHAVAVFERDTGTGTLTFVERQKDGVNGVDGLYRVASVTVSPDNAHLYAAGQYDDAVAVFSRNASTGALTFVERQKDGENTVDGLDGVSSVAVSPDGSHVYAAGQNDDAVAVFSRNASTGALTFVERQKDGENTVDGLDGASSVTVSPDGTHVYVTGEEDDAVAVFIRNAETGALTFVERQKDNENGVEGLDYAKSVTVSPDGDHLYVAGEYDDAVAVFSRNKTSGALTFVECHYDGINAVDGLNGVNSVTVSPDGANVYASGQFDHAVAVFRRNADTGALTFVEVRRDGENGVDGLDCPMSVAVSPDNLYIYSADRVDDAVTMFGRNNPPTVETPTIAEITETTATLGGTVSDLCGDNVLERGVYWSTTDGFTPPSEGTKVSQTGDWDTTGAFTVSVSGLSSGTTVYFKAFASNLIGTDYSSQSSFTTNTPPPSAPTGLTADSITQTTVDLSWTDTSDNESGFVVYQDGTEVTTTTADVTSYQVTGLTCETGYVFTITATNAGDESAPAATTPATTTTANCNQAPTDIELSSESVAENEAIGTTVGTFSTIDPDTGDTHTYSLVTGDGDTDNGSFIIDGDALKTKEMFDFETQQTYFIRVQTDDDHDGTYQEAFTITVTEVVSQSYILWTR